MRLRRRSSVSDDRQSQLTAMIDIIFLLLVFFVMTFRVVVSEGDFSLKAPRAKTTSRSVDQHFEVPLQIELQAGPKGQLAAIRLDGRPVDDVDELVDVVKEALVFEDASTGESAATIRCDPALHYEHTIQVVGALHGPPDSKLVQSIRLEKL